MTSLLDWGITIAQQELYEHIVQPLLRATGQMQLSELAFDAMEWPVIGLIEFFVIVPFLWALERAFPVEEVTDHAAIRTDAIYTFLHRFGVFPLLAFLLLTPAFDGLESMLRLAGLSRGNLDAFLPSLVDRPWVSFIGYLIVLDFADYWIHRGQHGWSRWWALHALHHSQRQMTFWSDDRNHVLDDLIRDALLAGVALMIGVAPSQFIWLVVASRVFQQLQHANVRLRFPKALSRLLVSPEFHRRHHGIGVGHEGAVKGVNFGVLFPWWDQLFGTADWADGFIPTGIRDQLQGRNYGDGLVEQQWLGLCRMVEPSNSEESPLMEHS
jgi:sterol desaturase/sphingolipid hydroxylase (fatty acid hydroxylase superfamily)